MIEFIKFDKVKQKYYLTETPRLANAIWDEIDDIYAQALFVRNKFTIEEENDIEIIYFYQYSLN